MEIKGSLLPELRYGIDEMRNHFAMRFVASTIRKLKILKRRIVLAHVTERYGVVSGATKEALLKSLAEGTPVPVHVGGRNEVVQATVVSMACSTNARRIFEVKLEGPFWQGKTRRVTVAKYDTNASTGGEGACEYEQVEKAY